MINLNSYYHEILTTFHFSITGYHSIEKRLNDFFKAFSNSTSILGKKHIDFVSYAYSKLVSVVPWELKSTHSSEFFFNTFNERSAELLMTHDYYAFKEYLKKLNNPVEAISLTLEEKGIVDGLKTSELAAAIFIKPTPYRILLSNKSYTIVKYDKHIDVLTFEIPFTEIFVETENEISKTRSFLYKLYEEELLKNEPDRIKLLVEKKDTIYKKSSPKTPTREETALCFSENANILCKGKIERLIKLLTNKLIELNQPRAGCFFKKHTNDEINKYYLECFAKLIISHAYLSFLFDCWVENIPSVVNVDEENNQQQCLGTFIVGYKQNQEITDDERALFRITSDRISSNLASIALLEMNKDLKRKLYAVKYNEFFQKYENIYPETVMHCNENIAEISSMKDLCKNYAHYISKTFLSTLESFHTQNMRLSKKFFFELTEDNISDTNTSIDLAIFKNIANNQAGKVCIGRYKDITLLNDIVKRFSSSSRYGGINVTSSNISPVNKNSEYLLTVVYKEEINLTNFFKELTSHRNGSLTSFLKENYWQIVANYNLLFYKKDEPNTELFLDFYNDLTPTKDKNGNKVLSLKTTVVTEIKLHQLQLKIELTQL